MSEQDEKALKMGTRGLSAVQELLERLLRATVSEIRVEFQNCHIWA